VKEDAEFVIGADEVGTGSLAGPMVVCAAIVPRDWQLAGLKDSKKLTPKRREKLHGEIQELFPFVRTLLDWTTSVDIDRLGLGKAHKAAFRRVVLAALQIEPNARVVLDGTIQLKDIVHESFPKADGLVPAVSAASVVAKVERDRWMETFADSEFPQYFFGDHKGYGSPAHLKALDEHGPCPIHRMSYEPVFKRAGVVGSK
jgi:ribonuclease HII